MAIRGVLIFPVASTDPLVGLQPGRDPVMPVVSKAEPVGCPGLFVPELGGTVVAWPGVGAGVGPAPLGTLLPVGSLVPGVPEFDGKLKD